MDSQADLVLSSGGTGFSPNDVTMACLSRSVIGITTKEDRQLMLVCLPGKPKAVRENFEILTKKGVLQHALAQMKSHEKH